MDQRNIELIQHSSSAPPLPQTIKLNDKLVNRQYGPYLQLKLEMGLNK
jgi:hypothetical protein